MNNPLPPPHVHEDAAEYLQGQLKRTGKNALLLTLRRTGCSGWSYAIDACDELPMDGVMASGGAPLYVRSIDLPLLADTQIRLQRLPLGTKVVFENPQETGTCGCGASVALAGP